ncbi:kinase-like domain-containing protein [Globomyces pollinis-pini]|nr:kinase-like domain-containing protein [Globomyces pollinis-pini]
MSTKQTPKLDFLNTDTLVHSKMIPTQKALSPTRHLSPLMLSIYDTINYPILLIHPIHYYILYSNHLATNLFKVHGGTNINQFFPNLTFPLSFNNSLKTLAMPSRKMVELTFTSLDKGIIDLDFIFVIHIKLLDDIAPVSRYEMEFQELSCIGKGGFANVYRSLNLLDGQEYAIKKVKLNCYPEEIEDADCLTPLTPSPTSTLLNTPIKERRLSIQDHRFLREVKTLATVSDHPNIVRYYNAWIESHPIPLPITPQEDYDTFEVADELTDSDARSTEILDELQSLNLDDDCLHEDQQTNFSTKFDPSEEKCFATLYIQMQLYDCQNLRLWLTNRSKIDKQQNLKIFFQLVSALSHCHSRSIIHRDIKPENIFMQNDKIHLGDFGLAKTIYDHTIPSGMLSQDGDSDDFGTFIYIAPEHITSSRRISPKSDIYSLGIVLFELFTQFNTAMERSIVLDSVKHGILPDSFVSNYPSISELVLNLTQNDAGLRLDANEILKLDLFQS